MLAVTLSKYTKNHKIFGAPTQVSKNKTIKYRFIEAKSTKQGVEEASLPSDTQRLCDLTLEPWTLAYAKRILAGEEIVRASSTVGVISTDNTPSAKFRVSCGLC